MKGKRKLNRLKAGILLLTGLILAVILFFIVFKGDFFIIKKLECRVDENWCRPDEEKYFLSVLGQNIFTVKITEKLSSLGEEGAYLKDLRIERRLPDKVIVQLKKRSAVAQAAHDYNSYYIFDETGTIFSQTEKDSSLPVVLLFTEFPLKKGIKSSDLEQIYQLIKYLRQYGIAVSDYILGSDYSLSIKTNDLEVLFSLDKDIKKQVASLQVILSRSKIEGKVLNRLDLRFEKPVAVFKP